MRTSHTKRKGFLSEKGARITAAATLNQTVVSVPTFQGSSTIFAAVEKDFGWQRATTAGAASAGSLANAMLGPFLGAMTDRIGSARMILVGLFVAGTGFILFSQVRTPWHYYAAWTLVSVGVSIGGFTPSIAAVNMWMSHRRASAMSIVLAGSSAGAVLVPLMAWSMAGLGWRTTVIGVGITFALIAPAISWTMRGRPPDMQTGGNRSAPASDGGISQYDFTPREALRTRAFWTISWSHALANLSTGVISSQVVLHLNAVGLSLTSASLVVPVMGGVAFVFQLVGGQIGDRMGKRVPASLFILIQAIAVVVLAFTNGMLMAMAFAVLWGIGFGGRTPLLHAMRGDYFGRKRYATIMSLSAVPMAIGMTVMPWVAGKVFDIQGNYQWVFVGLAVACAAGAGIILLATPPPATPQGSSAGLKRADP